MEEKITQQELRDMFGDHIPIEAVEMLFDPNGRVGEIRERWGAIAHEARLKIALAEIVGEVNGEADKHYDQKTAEEIIAYLKKNGYLLLPPVKR